MAQQPKQRTYLTIKYPGSSSGDKTALTGIRGIGKTLYIAGFYVNPNNSNLNTAFVYKGTKAEFDHPQNWHRLNYPSSPGVTVTGTNLYGPAVLDNDNIRVVGSYTTEQTGNSMLGSKDPGDENKQSLSSMLGCMYEGKLDGSGVWTTLLPNESAVNTIAHSTMGDIVVGNYDIGTPQGFAFVYDIREDKYYTLSHHDVTSMTAYCVYHDGGDSYTICGGFSTVDSEHRLYLGSAMITDWDNFRHKLVNWKEYNYPSIDNKQTSKTLVTHFEGITPRASNGYNLVGESADSNGVITILFAQVRNDHCQYSEAKWSPVMVPGSETTTGNSVYRDQVIGGYTLPNDTTLYGYISG